MIRRSVVFGVIFMVFTAAQGQKASIETVAISLKTYEKENEKAEIKKHSLEEAKKHADLAFANPTTSNDPYMWLMRARTYFALQTNKLGEDGKAYLASPDDIEKAVTAIINLHKTDDRKKYIRRVDAVVAFVNIAVQARYIADVAYNNKDFERAVKYYTMVREMIPYDTESQLKRQNISGEKLLFNIATTESQAGMYEESKKHFKELIEMKYNDPWIYLELYDIYLNQDNDTASAIQTIDEGRKMFEDNMNLRRQQIFIYTTSGRGDELIDIMNENLEVDPYNAANYYLRALLYQQKKDYEKAESDFLKALEYNDEMLGAHEDLGKYYYLRGADVAAEANKLGLNETDKFNKMNEEVKDYFKKAIPHFERVYELTEETSTKNQMAQALLSMYLTTEQTDKYSALKQELGK